MTNKTAPAPTTSRLMIEVSPASRGDGYQSGTGDLAAKAAEDALPSLAEAIGPAAAGFIEKLRNAKIKPEEVELELGVKLELGANWIVVSKAAEASITVRLKWKP